MDTTKPLWVRFLKTDEEALRNFIQQVTTEREIAYRHLLGAEDMLQLKEAQTKIHTLDAFLKQITGDVS